VDDAVAVGVVEGAEDLGEVLGVAAAEDEGVDLGIGDHLLEGGEGAQAELGGEANIYDTERWPEYRKLYRQVAGEVETVADIFTLQYILVAELEDQTRTGKDCQPQPTDPKDERLIHLIRCELMGEPLEMYKTMINPIIALKKRFV
jgi:hypothetical protein